MGHGGDPEQKAKHDIQQRGLHELALRQTAGGGSKNDRMTGRKLFMRRQANGGGESPTIKNNCGVGTHCHLKQLRLVARRRFQPQLLVA